jgi:hypothetical protein
MRFNNSIREILFLTALFTVLALYLNIHNEGRVIGFIINHIIALLLALILSKGITHFLIGHK